MSRVPSLYSLTEGKQQELASHPPYLLYGYTRDAMHDRTVNGYPVFSTVGLLWQRDAELLAAHDSRIKAAVDAVMAEAVEPEAKPAPKPVKPVSPVAMTQRLLSVKDFGALLGVSLWTVRAWAYKGRVASVKLGARMMIPATELDRLIAENTRPALSHSN